MIIAHVGFWRLLILVASTVLTSDGMAVHRKGA